LTQPARVALQRAEHLRIAKRPREALEALGPALAEPATAYDAYCTQALVFGDLGRSAEALEAARHAQAANPLGERGFRIEGLIRVNHLDGKGAETPAREAVRLESNPWTRYLLVHALRKRHQQREARAIAAALVADEPHNALSCDALGVVELRARNWAAAEASYRKAVELEPPNALYATRLGLALQAQKKTAEAGSAYLAAARSDPTDAAHRRRLAQVGLTAGAGGFFTLIKFGLLANVGRIVTDSNGSGQRAALIAWAGFSSSTGS
jgi:tetratricopeptide (TPR) repeat protein